MFNQPVASKITLAIIIFSAFLLRFVNLSSNPIGFNDDEAAFGYNAYSIAKTGMDEWGRLLPFPAFESFGDWKLVGYLYPVVISEMIFGPSVFAARLPSALIGVAAVFSTYLLAKELFKTDKNSTAYGLISTLLIAISPWHIIASRNAFESDVLIFTITMSACFFLKALDQHKYFKYALGMFIVSFYIYRSAWVFLPLFAAVLLLTFRKKLTGRWRSLWKYVAIAAIGLTPIVFLVFTYKGQSRFFQESFIYGVSKTGIINDVNMRRGACDSSLSPTVCKLGYNKYLSFTTTYFNNYFENLSPQTYFTKGPANGYQSFPNRGLFYSFELPLLIIGLATLIKRHDSTSGILIAWLLIVPIGASFTGVGNPGRLNIIMPSPQIIEALGLVSIFAFAKSMAFKKILFVSAVLIVAVSFSRLLLDMFYYYPYISGPYQRYGYKQLFDYLQSKKDNYLQIAVSRRSDDAKQYIHYLFDEKIDPNQIFYSQFTNRYRGDDKWQVFEQTGNFRFYPISPGLNQLPPKTLLAVGTLVKEVSFPIDPVFVVDYPNGDRAFEVYDIDQVKSKLNEKHNLQ